MSFPLFTYLLAQAPAPRPPAETGADEEFLYDIILTQPKAVWWPYLVLPLVILLVLGIVAFVLWRLLRSKTPSLPPPGPRATIRLDRIEKERKSMEVNRYALEISETLKDYLSQKFEDPVRYETAQEFLDRASDGRSELPFVAQQELKEFLRSSEELKFGNPYEDDRRFPLLIKHARNVLTLCESVSQEPLKKKP